MRGWRPPAIAVDSALAFVLTVLYLPGAMDDEPTAVVVPLALVQTLPLAFRRVRPVSVLAVTLVSGIVFNVGFADSPTLPLGVVVSLYTVAVYCERTVSTRAALVTAVALPVPILVAAGFAVDSALLPLGITAGAWMLGDNLRTRRVYLSELEAKAVRLEREREQEARRAVARERARIARELRERLPEVGVLLLSHHLESRYAMRLLGEYPGASATCSRTVLATWPWSRTPCDGSARGSA